MSKRKIIPSLPRLLKNKIYKTGQTKGADDDVIFQNRVNRNNTVLIPYIYFENCKTAPDNNGVYQNGMIVLVKPDEYYKTKEIPKILKKQGLVLGKNALLFYYSREQWSKYNPIKKKLKPANSRKSPLGGKFVARVPATTSSSDEKIRLGFTSSKLKGAGIRVYEYASSNIISDCKIQLEYLFWKCKDALEVVIDEGMAKDRATIRRTIIYKKARELKLDNKTNLVAARILNQNNLTICPLCLEEISAIGFFNKVRQAKGREVSDLTVTQLNLFHVEELRTQQFNHRPYNLGWGHHHCNIVVKDSGIDETLHWMNQVIKRNKKQGFEFT